jgi:SAM-dependent methyltransferase
MAITRWLAPLAASTPRQNGLALHYIKNLPGLLANIHAALKPGSRFVFSIEHPIFMHRVTPAGSPMPTAARAGR